MSSGNPFSVAAASKAAIASRRKAKPGSEELAALCQHLQLENKQLKYAQIFYEGQHDDARTCITIALSAAAHGAAIANYVEAVAIVYDDATGKATGVVAKDLVAGGEVTIRAKKLLFAGGPFTDELRELESEGCPSAVRGAAGTHIVLPSYYCPNGIGLLDINTSDGRFLFLLPWEGEVPFVFSVPFSSFFLLLISCVATCLCDDFERGSSRIRSCWDDGPLRGPRVEPIAARG